jgi:hypothetical protein
MCRVLEVRMLNSLHRSLGSIPGQSVWSGVYHFFPSRFSVSIVFKSTVPQGTLTIAHHLPIRSAQGTYIKTTTTNLI